KEKHHGLLLIQEMHNKNYEESTRKKSRKESCQEKEIIVSFHTPIKAPCQARGLFIDPALKL
ncbi:MAG: hypothetical protein V2A70_01570, partial [Candidatus Omnitrophota bacterium]